MSDIGKSAQEYIEQEQSWLDKKDYGVLLDECLKLEAELKLKDQEIKSLSENFGLLNIECLKLTAQLRIAVEAIEIGLSCTDDEQWRANGCPNVYSVLRVALDKINELKKG